MTSSSEKATSLKPEAQKAWAQKSKCSVAGQRPARGLSGELFRAEFSFWKERQRTKEGSFVVLMSPSFSRLLQNTPSVSIVLQSSVLDHLLLNVSGHSFPAPLETKARAQVPPISALVEIELSHRT